MECALWLNRRKVYSADEIAEAPDIAALRGYFLAGSLVEWLNEHGGEHYAKKLAKLRSDDPKLNEKLARIFGGSPSDGKRFGDGSVSPASGSMSSSLPGSFIWSALSSYGSFTRSWKELLTSFRLGSYVFGSGMHEWEWEWLFRMYRSGSFTSFGFTSFGAFKRSRFFNVIGYGSFGSFTFGSFWGNIGSFPLPEAIDLDCLDEYDRIMLETLMMCPLDRFGYGIHNI
ncbi:MAG: hypothetical protein K2N38_14205 [Oscillospiraceae bacterium]|nr:hypothetical protein [Oscillospiraceae bacterium]